METQTAYEVAEELRCSPRKVIDVAKRISVGANLEGRAGWRFEEADKLAIWEAMRPKKPVAARRRRRA